jgi:hypothetical protein
MKSGHHSQEDQAQLHSSMSSGLGIVPRAAETDYIRTHNKQEFVSISIYLLSAWINPNDM